LPAVRIHAGTSPRSAVTKKGFDHLILIGVGPDQDGFMRFWERELAPALHASH
jgi:hypothetical protein